MEKLLLVSCLSICLINAMEESVSENKAQQLSILAVQAEKTTLRPEATEFVPKNKRPVPVENNAAASQDALTLAQRRGADVVPIKIQKVKPVLPRRKLQFRGVSHNPVWWQVPPNFYHNDPFQNQLIASQLSFLQAEHKRNGTLVCCMFGCPNQFKHPLIEHFSELKEHFEKKPIRLMKVVIA